MKRKLVFNDGSSNKFWDIEYDNNSYTVTYGKIGSNGTTKTTEISNAEVEAVKLLNSKIKKGYVEVLDDSSGDSNDDSLVFKNNDFKASILCHLVKNNIYKITNEESIDDVVITKDMIESIETLDVNVGSGLQKNISIKLYTNTYKIDKLSKSEISQLTNLKKVIAHCNIEFDSFIEFSNLNIEVVFLDEEDYLNNLVKNIDYRKDLMKYYGDAVHGHIYSKANAAITALLKKYKGKVKSGFIECEDFNFYTEVEDLQTLEEDTWRDLKDELEEACLSNRFFSIYTHIDFLFVRSGNGPCKCDNPKFKEIYHVYYKEKINEYVLFIDLVDSDKFIEVSNKTQVSLKNKNEPNNEGRLEKQINYLVNNGYVEVKGFDYASIGIISENQIKVKSSEEIGLENERIEKERKEKLELERKEQEKKLELERKEKLELEAKLKEEKKVAEAKQLLSELNKDDPFDAALIDLYNKSIELKNLDYSDPNSIQLASTLPVEVSNLSIKISGMMMREMMAAPASPKGNEMAAKYAKINTLIY